MKSEELLYSLDYVGEDLLGAAEQTVLARKKRPWLRTAVAAVLSVAEELNVNALFMSAGPQRGRTTSFTEPES